ncbi:hypothetical protein GCM10020001_087930 [Nonomuraea salmonea]
MPGLDLMTMPPSSTTWFTGLTAGRAWRVKTMRPYGTPASSRIASDTGSSRRRRSSSWYVIPPACLFPPLAQVGTKVPFRCGRRSSHRASRTRAPASAPLMRSVAGAVEEEHGGVVQEGAARV